jgi:autophagy-related protein 2
MQINRKGLFKVFSFRSLSRTHVLTTVGLHGASRSLRRNFRDAKDAIFTLPAEMAEGGDARGVAIAIARAAPRAVIRPAIGVSEAVGRTLMGVGNAMEPERKRAREDKYKRH